MDLSHLLDSVPDTAEAGVYGRVHSVLGTRVQAFVPDATIGDLVSVERPGLAPLLTEIVGFSDQDVTLLPLGPSNGLTIHARVKALRRPLEVATGPDALGRVLDGLGQPLDGRPPIVGPLHRVDAECPSPMDRPAIERPISLGIRSIDGLLTLGEGQRIGLFAGPGAGKSQLLAQCARQTEADVFVLALVGERGRELREFLERALGAEGIRRGVVICATSDSPPLVRMKSAMVAMTHAEAFRARGQRVLFLMDSVTRFARAARDVGLSAGEAPVRRGYPPSVFAALPPLLERCGRTQSGSITALCTVLIEGDELDDPIADELRGLLDGHIALSRELAARGHFPAVDILESLSRCMPQVSGKAQQALAQTLRTHLARHREKRDLISLGAYHPGSDPALDDTLARIPAIEGFLQQDTHERTEPGETLERLAELFR
ncbi:MAG: FliI/YscN family ATPase [Myxococcales bacterium]|nr:FliI/YscN family ATPase [Myxococcales bacterium]